jgi:glycosyltransferase involved in cell wall biosynthesis
VTTRLRVGFDGRALTSPAAGVRRYTNELLRALAGLGEPLDLVILGGDPSAPAPEGAERISEPLHLPTNAGWTLLGLPQAMRRGRVDLLHAPSYTAPFWAPAPVVVTVHDVSYARRPEFFPYRRDAVRRAFYRWSAVGATLVVTDSTFSASEIRAAYGIPADRIVVVPLGVDASFQTTAAAAASEPGARAPFVLHVGDLHERRNLPMLLEAVLAARARTPALRGLSLTMAGIDRGVGPSLRALAAAGGAPDAVLLLGPVDETRLRTLYREAFALAYPSLYEGFGLPLIEAMASGLPVLASQAASIPEVVGTGGLLLDPQRASDWTNALVRLATDASLAADLRARGRSRAAMFTWKRTAEMTLDVYRRAVRERR